MEAPRSVRRSEGSRIQPPPSRDGGGAAARGRSASMARPPWYRRALGGLLRWRKPAAVEAPAPAAKGKPPLWRSSLKAVGAALARAACICEQACPGVHADALVPRRRRRGKRGDTRSGGRSPPVAMPAVSMPAGEWENWRCLYIGRPMTANDDVLVRRLVLEEEDATRRRMEMKEASNRYGRRWFPPGPSRLSQMSMAGDEEDDDVYGDDGEGENSSTSPQCSDYFQSL